jgi:phosphatidylserine/phosphatidylglycerophosphate/cardiolipin synthase-like enzyme
MAYAGRRRKRRCSHNTRADLPMAQPPAEPTGDRSLTDLQAKPDPALLEGLELHQAVIDDGVLQARQFVWIATADLKDMHVRRGQRFIPLLHVFDDMAQRGVQFRLVHSALPSRPFRASLESCEHLTSGGMELQICPRSHWKIVVVDGRMAYCGSANFTGAGLGARSAHKRNFEIGMVGTEANFVASLMRRFDDFWMGRRCGDCRLRDICPDPIV